jgi:hypothetical protein
MLYIRFWSIMWDKQALNIISQENSWSKSCRACLKLQILFQSFKPHIQGWLAKSTFAQLKLVKNRGISWGFAFSKTCSQWSLDFMPLLGSTLKPEAPLLLPWPLITYAHTLAINYEYVRGSTIVNRYLFLHDLQFIFCESLDPSNFIFWAIPQF